MRHSSRHSSRLSSRLSSQLFCFFVGSGSLVLACGDDERASAGMTSEGPASAGSDVDTTTASAATGDEPTSTGGATSTTSTTGEVSTSGSSGNTSESSTSGPICDPGSENCVCDAGTCMGELLCVDDLCVAALSCDADLTEPDDDELAAHDLGEISDDDTETLAAAGVLSGTADRDWYRYHGLDTFGYTADPTVKLTVSGSVRLCQFLECDEGGVAFTELTCPQGTQDALSGALRPGCCGSAVFTISDFNCQGTNENISVYIRVDKASDDVCIDYSLTLHN